MEALDASLASLRRGILQSLATTINGFKVAPKLRHQLQGPLMIFHGRNDPRVKINQSDRMVSALRALDKPLDYVVLENEGHGFGHWKNQLDYYRRVEDFLANCLGGRSSGFDYYQLGSWFF